MKFLKITLVRLLSRVLSFDIAMVLLIKMIDDGAKKGGEVVLDARIFHALEKRVAMIGMSARPELKELLDKIKAGDFEDSAFGKEEERPVVH